MKVKSVYDQLTIAIRDMRKQLKDIENLISSTSSKVKREPVVGKLIELRSNDGGGSQCSNCSEKDMLTASKKSSLLKILRMARSLGLLSDEEFANQRIVRSAQLSNGSNAQASSANSGPDVPIKRAKNNDFADVVTNSNVSTPKSQSEGQMLNGIDVSGNNSFHIK